MTNDSTNEKGADAIDASARAVDEIAGAAMWRKKTRSPRTAGSKVDPWVWSHMATPAMSGRAVHVSRNGSSAVYQACALHPRNQRR